MGELVAEIQLPGISVSIVSGIDPTHRPGRPPATNGPLTAACQCSPCG